MEINLQIDKKNIEKDFLRKAVELMNHLDSEMKSASIATLVQHFPDQQYSSDVIFRTFKRMVARKCDTWVIIPDNLVVKN